MSERALFFRGVVLSLFFFFLGGCVAPVLPLPPPSPSDLSLKFDAQNGQVVLSGAKNPTFSGTMIYLFNQSIGKGTITRAKSDGSFLCDPIEAQEGHQLDLWAARYAEDEESSVVCLVVDSKAERGFHECQ